MEVLDRLRRLEEQAGLATGPISTHNEHPLTPSVADSGTVRSDEALTRVAPYVARDMIRGMKDEDARSMILSNIFCPLRQIDSCLFDNTRCLTALRFAISEIESAQNVQTIELSGPKFPKDLARKLIESESSHRARQCII